MPRSYPSCHLHNEARKEGETALRCTICSARPADGQIELQITAVRAGQKWKALTEASRAARDNQIRIAVLDRPNGLVHFEFDLWRTPWDLQPEICEKLRILWDRQVAQYRTRTRKRQTINGVIGKTYSNFDVPSEFSERWQFLLTVLLSTGVGLEQIS